MCLIYPVPRKIENRNGKYGIKYLLLEASESFQIVPAKSVTMIPLFCKQSLPVKLLQSIISLILRQPSSGSAKAPKISFTPEMKLSEVRSPPSDGQVNGPGYPNCDTSIRYWNIGCNIGWIVAIRNWQFSKNASFSISMIPIQILGT